MMKNSNSPTFIFLLTIFLATSQCFITVTAQNLIAQVCKKTPLDSLCRSFLQSGSRTSQGDLKGLSLIATNASQARAARLSKYIDTIVKDNPKAKDALKCVEGLSRIAWDLAPFAFNALQTNDKKAAAEVMSTVVVTAKECKLSLKQKPQAVLQKQWDQLKNEANTMYKSVVVNESIIKMLLLS
ncbi:pectinesterase inhibitor-like [Actinidia eriantha]|uniref:pectinesterase inhibitor-like n=1 Tax=Actinidia eriantha TaxID=165200 RepID=UPI00258BEEED|nr:pectinesterase inhibitor-like [Actinidia eriantha]